jgi:hypothetical protein
MGGCVEGEGRETQVQMLGKIAVGGLASLGWEVSRPWLLHQAYVSTGEHAMRADREYDGEGGNCDEESEDDDDDESDEFGDDEDTLMQDTIDTL